MGSQAPTDFEQNRQIYLIFVAGFDGEIHDRH